MECVSSHYTSTLNYKKRPRGFPLGLLKFINTNYCAGAVVGLLQPEPEDWQQDFFFLPFPPSLTAAEIVPATIAIRAKLNTIFFI
jgi:hypothetical protein